MSYTSIISLVPSLTELLIDIGLKEQLVGRTRFCVHPKPGVEDIPIMGGTKNPRLDKIRAAKPDFILANKEENRREDIKSLEKNFNVWLTDIATIEDALITIHELGKELGKNETAQKLVQHINSTLADRPNETALNVAYLIWKDPWMTVGGDTYINDVLKHWNMHNVFSSKNRYPAVSLKQLAEQKPELVLLSSEPYPFKEKHIPEIEKTVPEARILLVEGEWFSWYGSHMLHSFQRLNTWRKAIA